MKTGLGLAALAAGTLAEAGSVLVEHKENWNLPVPPADDDGFSGQRWWTSTTDLFRKSSYQIYPYDYSTVNASSYAGWGHSQDNVFKEKKAYVSSSLTFAALEAWGRHQDFIIRPDTVWFEILSQISLYRSLEPGATHDQIRSWVSDRITVPRDWMGDSFTSKISQKLSDLNIHSRKQGVKEWVSPGFSTSKNGVDDLTAMAILVGKPQYLRYSHKQSTCLDKNSLPETQGSCGWPTVSLLGNKADWQKLLTKAEELQEWGWQAKEYLAALRPILKRFIKTWDEPKSAETLEFWSQMLVPKMPTDCYMGHFVVTGWINGFYYWSPEGRAFNTGREGGVTLDGISYSPRGIHDLPMSYSAVPLKIQGVEEDVSEYNLVAGNIGVQRDDMMPASGRQVSAEPLSGWYVYGPRSELEVPEPYHWVNRIGGYLRSCWYERRPEPADE